MFFFCISLCFLGLKTSKIGERTDGGETTAATWQFFEDMYEILDARPSVDPQW